LVRYWPISRLCGSDFEAQGGTRATLPDGECGVPLEELEVFLGWLRVTVVPWRRGGEYPQLCGICRCRGSGRARCVQGSAAGTGGVRPLDGGAYIPAGGTTASTLLMTVCRPQGAGVPNILRGRRLVRMPEIYGTAALWVCPGGFQMGGGQAIAAFASGRQ